MLVSKPNFGARPRASKSVNSAYLEKLANKPREIILLLVKQPAMVTAHIKYVRLRRPMRTEGESERQWLG